MAQTSNPDSVKESTKAVGHDTKNAAKATGKTVKKTTKKVVHRAPRPLAKAHPR